MSLSRYNQKRSFEKTSEPTGGKATGNSLRFVIQKHDASRLHYDFRLEMDGVLKSWAVPKGPSLNPSVKRLAMMVEDHPYDYRNFEGIIPEGNYGAGTVIVWDEGFYEPIETVKGRKAQEKELLKELKAGSLKFILHGKKLKGEFALVKTKGMSDNAWLLIKHRDEYAAEADITAKDRSVLSRKTIAQMAKQTDQVYSPKKTAARKRKSRQTNEEQRPGTDENEESDVAALWRQGEKKAFYTTAKPMLATLVDEPFEKEGWIYEVKWDGYRALAFMNKGKVALKSRNNISFEEKYGAVYDALQQWHVNAIVDGEVLVLDDKGIPDFEALQNRGRETRGTLVYYVFDLLWLNGKDVTQLPLTERKTLLKSIMPGDDIIRYSDHFETGAKKLLRQVKQKGLEGLMAKKADSIYRTDYRTKEWLKIKDNNRQEMVIGGFTRNIDTRKPFSALLMGVFRKRKFVFTGKVGTGFNTRMQQNMMEQMEPLITDENPFEPVPERSGRTGLYTKAHVASTTWLQPQLIAEVAFTEMTKDGMMRHPSFIAMRTDKKAKEVRLEKPEKANDMVSAKKKPAARKDR